MTMQIDTRILLALTGMLLLSAVVVGGAAAAPVDGGDTVPAMQDDQNQTETQPDENGTDDGSPDATPPMANRTRLSPVNFDEGWSQVDTVDAEEQYNTTGAVVVFSSTQPIDTARIQQSGAEARVLEGGHQVQVIYEDDAAGRTDTTFFELELFFEDGSDLGVELYASQTDVSAAAAEYEQYSKFIDTVLEDAGEEGFEQTPEGATEHYEWMQERLEVLDMLFVDRALQLVTTMQLLFINPLFYVTVLVGVMVLFWRREKSLGWMLDRMQNDAGAATRRLEQIRASYREHIQTANEEHIAALDQIDQQQAAYLEDAYDTWSVRQLAELGRRGPDDVRQRIDEDVVTDGGELTSAIAKLDADEIDESWLQPAISQNRLSSPVEALSCIKAALVRMESKYGMGHVYKEARVDCERLIDELEEKEGLH